MKTAEKENIIKLAIERFEGIAGYGNPADQKAIEGLRHLLIHLTASQPNQLKQEEGWDEIKAIYKEYEQWQSFIGSDYVFKWLEQHYSAPKDSGKELIDEDDNIRI